MYYSEVKLSLASLLSDRIVDEILDSLSVSQHSLVTCLSPSVCLSVCLSAQSGNLSVSLCKSVSQHSLITCLSPSVCLSVSQHSLITCLSPSVCLSVCLSAQSGNRLSICLSVCLPACLDRAITSVSFS